MVSRLRRGVPMFALLLTACSDDPADNFVAVLLGTVVGLILAGMLGCSLYTGCIVGGALNVRHNLKAPTARSKRWGFVFGPLNLVNGGVVLAILVKTMTDPETEATLDGVLYLGGFGAVAIAVGITAVVVAMRARPEPNLDATDALPPR